MSTDLRVVAFMRARPGQEKAVREAILDCVAPSRREGECLDYDAHVDVDDPALFVVVEHWGSAPARALHLKSDHFKALTRAVDESGKLSEHFFKVLHPITAEEGPEVKGGG